MTGSVPDPLADLPEIGPAELERRLAMDQPIVLLDVREPFEKEIADLPEKGQLRIPMGEVPERLGELDPEAPLVVYCRTGGRSGRVVRFLQAQGFRQAMNLRGGVMGWREEVDPSLTEY